MVNRFSPSRVMILATDAYDGSYSYAYYVIFAKTIHPLAMHYAVVHYYGT